MEELHLDKVPLREGLRFLESVYGYTPTFHDARIVNLRLTNFLAECEIDITYTDMLVEREGNLRCDMTITLREVSLLRLQLKECWLDSLLVHQEADGINLVFVELSLGETSTITADEAFLSVSNVAQLHSS